MTTKTEITISDVKTKYMVYRVLEMTNDKVFARWEADPENAELEAFADKTYEGMWNALDRFTAAVETYTDGKVDQKTARRMVTCPKYREMLEKLMEQVA